MSQSKSRPLSDALADARLSTVLESISDAYYAVDRDWKIVMFNGSAEDFFGLSRGEALGRDLWSLYGLGRETEFGRLLVRAMEERVPGRMTAPSALRTQRTVEVRVSPLGEEGVGVSVDDITERHNAERALRQSERRLDLAVSAHHIGIFDWHVPSGRIVWSREEEQMFGLEPGSFGGDYESWKRHVLAEDITRVEGELREAMAAERDRLDFEFRIRRPDGEVRHVEGAGRFLYAPDGAPLRMVGTNIDVTDRKVAEAHQRLLINELNHRVKNTLAIVQAIAWQSLRGSAPPEVRDAFEGRLAALSAAHDVLTQQSWESAAIDRIIVEATAPHQDGRISAEGPAVELAPKTAVALGLAMHELATNAVKHGALSASAGRVEIRWRVEADRLSLIWTERGGPPARAPARRGFGFRMLEKGLADELRGEVRLDFRPEGLVCRLEAALRT